MREKISRLLMMPLLINSLLLALLFSTWFFYNPRSKPDISFVSQPIAGWPVDTSSIEEQESYNQLAIIAEKPLFHQSRQPAVLEVISPQEVNDSRVKIDDLQLKGIVYKASGQSIAYASNRLTGNEYKVTAGEYIDGWKIEKITKNEVFLSRENEQGSLSLLASNQGN